MVGTDRVKRVLLIKNDASVALDMLQLLSPYCEAVAVSSAHRAVKLLLSGPWDVVLTDFELGRDSPLDGIEVLQAAQMLVPKAQRVLCAAALPPMSPDDAEVIDVCLTTPCAAMALLAGLGLKV